MSTSETVDCVLAIDPGTAKCGLAIVRRSSGAGTNILHHSVVSRDQLEPTIRELVSQYSPGVILMGNGTACRECEQTAERLGVGPMTLVDEKFSTLLARKLYFQHNPPRGLRRLIPTSLQTPDRPYDDYVAIILARSFLSTQP